MSVLSSLIVRTWPAMPVHVSGSERGTSGKTSKKLLCLVMGITLVAFCPSLHAQRGPFPQTSSPKGIGFAYDRAREVTIEGTVKKVIWQSDYGLCGAYLVVQSAGKTVSAHLGPWISQEQRRKLVSGQFVEMVGVYERGRTGNVLLARKLVINGEVVTVRNERGFLVRSYRPSSRPTPSPISIVRGGVR